MCHGLNLDHAASSKRRAQQPINVKIFSTLLLALPKNLTLLDFGQAARAASTGIYITCRRFSLRNYRSSTTMELWLYFKNGGRSNKTVHICFNKLHLKYGKKTCFTFALKYEETFSPTQY